MGLGITDGSLSPPQASFILLTAALLEFLCFVLPPHIEFALYSQARLLIGGGGDGDWGRAGSMREF